MLSSSFTIGADPELICFKNGNFTPAHHYFKANSSFGLDGCDQTAEVRCGYSESPLDVTSKIFQIFNRQRSSVFSFPSPHLIWCSRMPYYFSGKPCLIRFGISNLIIGAYLSFVICPFGILRLLVILLSFSFFN